MFVLLLYRHIDGATPYIIFCVIQIVTPYKIQMNVGYIVKITPRLYTIPAYTIGRLYGSIL